jgi:predicted TIM-barrel fold metal-dependent hydrolase
MSASDTKQQLDVDLSPTRLPWLDYHNLVLRRSKWLDPEKSTSAAPMKAARKFAAVIELQLGSSAIAPWRTLLAAPHMSANDPKRTWPNARSDPNVGRQRFQGAVDRMKSRGWHIQMYTSLAVISGIKDLVLEAPVPVVFDHFGGAQAALGIDQPGFADLVELVRVGKAYVKISGAYRASKLAPDYQDAEPLAKALIAANVDQVIWGTDWPHPNSSSGNKATEVTEVPTFLRATPIRACKCDPRRREIAAGRRGYVCGNRTHSRGRRN